MRCYEYGGITTAKDSLKNRQTAFGLLYPNAREMGLFSAVPLKLNIFQLECKLYNCPKVVSQLFEFK